MKSDAMQDPRDIANGHEIPSEGYCDQPYVVVLPDGAWLCVMTTGAGREGERGQHVVATRSEDRGETWSPLVDIEPDQYGYTVIAPGFGFLRDVFTEPYIVNWRLTRNGAVSDGMPGITIPYEAFPGSIGVMPGEEELDKILKRETDLAGAGGVVLPRDRSVGVTAAVVRGAAGHAFVYLYQFAVSTYQVHSPIFAGVIYVMVFIDIHSLFCPFRRI